MIYFGLWATTTGFKALIDRARPESLEGIVWTSPSFPSGHGGVAVALYGFVAYLIAREVQSRRARIVIVLRAILIAGLIGFTSLYLSVHYLSDVLAGFLVGGFWLLIGCALAEYRRRKAEIRNEG